MWEFGAEEPRYVCYMKVGTLTTDGSGHCALHFTLSNNAAPPALERAEFGIGADVGAINTLGRLLRIFADLKHEVLFWTPAAGHLIPTAAEVDALSASPGLSTLQLGYLLSQSNQSS